MATYIVTRMNDESARMSSATARNQHENFHHAQPYAVRAAAAAIDDYF